MNKLACLWLTCIAAFTAACSETKAPTPPTAAQLMARLQKNVPRISGRVTMADGVTLAPNAQVSLYAIEQEGSGRGDSGPLYHRNRDLLSPLIGAGLPDPYYSVAVDHLGRFDIALAPGQYIVHAVLGTFVYRDLGPITVSFEDELEPLMIRMPPTGVLAGKLEGGDHANFEPMVGVVRPIDDAALACATADLPTFELAADGSFRTGPLLAVPSRVTLYRVDSNDSVPAITKASIQFAHYRGHSYEIGRVDITAGEATHSDFQLEDRWPARCRLHLLVNGEPAAGYELQLIRTEQPIRGCSFRTDAQGFDDHGSLEPGEYRAILEAPDSSWVTELPDRVVLRANEVRELDLDVALTTARIQIVEARGERPVGNAELWLQTPHGVSRSPTSKRTDANGWIELSLPSGDYEYGCSRRDGSEGKRYLWGRLSWGPDGPENWPAQGSRQLAPSSDEARIRTE